MRWPISALDIMDSEAKAAQLHEGVRNILCDRSSGNSLIPAYRPEQLHSGWR